MSQHSFGPAGCDTTSSVKPVAAVHLGTMEVQLLLGKHENAHTAAAAVAIAAATALLLSPSSRARNPPERAVLVVIPVRIAHFLLRAPAVWCLQLINTPISNGLLVSHSM